MAAEEDTGEEWPVRALGPRFPMKRCRGGRRCRCGRCAPSKARAKAAALSSGEKFGAGESSTGRLEPLLRLSGRIMTIEPGIGEGAGGVQAREGVNDDEVAALDIVGAGAEGLFALESEVAAGEDGVEVADEQEALALGAFVLGEQVAGAAGGSGKFGEAVVKAEGRELGAVEVGELADAGEALGGAVDLDGGRGRG